MGPNKKDQPNCHLKLPWSLVYIFELGPLPTFVQLVVVTITIQLRVKELQVVQLRQGATLKQEAVQQQGVTPQQRVTPQQGVIIQQQVVTQRPQVLKLVATQPLAKLVVIRPEVVQPVRVAQLV